MTTTCSRRRLLLASATLPVAASPLQLFAKAAYPERPIRLLVGFPAGQSTDIIARLIAHKMSEGLGQSVVVDNKPGAAGIISHELAKSAPADGYTLLIAAQGSYAINPVLYRNLPYDSVADYVPIATMIGAPFVCITGGQSKIKDLAGLIKLARNQPGQLTFGSPGPGTGTHIAMEMFRKALGLDMIHVPYKGSPPMISDIVAGRVDCAFDSAPSVLGFARQGQLRMLGISTAARHPALPELPTIAEQGVAGFDVGGWTVLLAPKGTPPEIVQVLNAAVNKALADPAVVAELPRMSAYALGGSVAQTQAFLRTESARWQKATRESGARAD